MNWTEFLKQFFTVTTITGSITWLMKELGQILINRNQKKYELDLNLKTENYKSELNLTTEKFKSELGLLVEKANKLHIKRIERIEEMHSLLTDFYNDMQDLISTKIVTGMSMEEIAKQNFDYVIKAGKSGNVFVSYYSKNKLYFNIETCNLIDEIIELLQESYLNFSFKYKFGTISPDVEINHIKEATEKIREKVPKIKIELEANFREIIGVEK